MLVKVAITGASGYLGLLLTRLLDADPAIESILGLDIAAPAYRSPKFTFQRADVRSADFKSLLKGIDGVYHLAFIVGPPRRMAMSTIEEINVGGSRRLFDGAIAAGVPRIIYASSTSAYGAHPDNPERLTEDAPLRPNEDWYYSRCKGRVEFLLDDLEKRHPETIVIRFRPCVFLGPNVDNPMGDLFTGRLLVCLNRNLKLDLCWDEDVVEAFRLALAYDRSDTFNLAADDPLSWDEAGSILRKPVLHLRREWVVPFLKMGVAAGLLPKGMLEWVTVGMNGSILVSADRARMRLGWSPKFNCAETLVKYVNTARLRPLQWRSAVPLKGVTVQKGRTP
jgi:UDP-glucose 4-epimerase